MRSDSARCLSFSTRPDNGFEITIGHADDPIPRALAT